MDFKGQQLAEQLMIWICVAAGVVSFLAGYIMSDFQLMLKINAAGLVLATIVVVPSWPFYNRNPLKWLPALNPDEAEDKKTK